jgi:hypothetical protein
MMERRMNSRAFMGTLSECSTGSVRAVQAHPVCCVAEPTAAFQPTHGVVPR